MKDPLRLVESEGSATALERELLRAGRELGPDAEARRGIWLGIAAQCLPPAAGVAAGVATGAAVGTSAAGHGVGSVLSLLTSFKGIVVVFLVGGGAVAGYTVAGHWGQHQPVSSAGPQNSTQLKAATLRAAGPSGSTLEPPAAPAAPVDVSTPMAAGSGALKSRPSTSIADGASARRGQIPSPVQSSHLAEESRVILQARGALRASQPGEALRLLESAGRLFPAGALTQEREALAVEALVKTGQSSAARDRAAAFLRAYPNSPHASDVRRLVP
jgi:hypothetical protein